MIMVTYLGHATKVPNGTRHYDCWLWTRNWWWRGWWRQQQVSYCRVLSVCYVKKIWCDYIPPTEWANCLLLIHILGGDGSLVMFHPGRLHIQERKSHEIVMIFQILVSNITMVCSRVDLFHYNWDTIQALLSRKNSKPADIQQLKTTKNSRQIQLTLKLLTNQL